MKATKIAIAAVVVALAGCATQQPVVYPNDYYKKVGASTAQADVAQCKRLAETSGVRASSRGPEPADVAINTGTGAAVGAAGGAVYGHAGRGAAAGAAGAAAGTIFRGVFRPRSNPAYHRFVEQCLRDKGYQVTGWQ